MSPFDRVRMTSYERSIVTMGLSRTVSEIEGDFSRKPLVFCAPIEGVPLGIEYRHRGSKN